MAPSHSLSLQRVQTLLVTWTVTVYRLPPRQPLSHVEAQALHTPPLMSQPHRVANKYMMDESRQSSSNPVGENTPHFVDELSSCPFYWERRETSSAKKNQPVTTANFRLMKTCSL